MEDVSGRVAVITGAASGIGRALVDVFLVGAYSWMAPRPPEPPSS